MAIEYVRLIDKELIENLSEGDEFIVISGGKVKRLSGAGISEVIGNNDDLIILSKTQPDNPNNMVWLDDSEEPIEIPTMDDLKDYVKIVAGKGLSSNDFTNAEKSKLASLQNYDDTEIRGLIMTAVKTVLTNGVNDWTDAEKTAAQIKLGLLQMTQAEYDSIVLKDESNYYFQTEE